jgi:hypothetical protein
MSDEVTTHQIEGVCDGVMMKGDWQEYHVNIGKQYPVKLSTKHDDIKLLAAAAGTDKAIWTYTERQGGPNPHRPGEFFKNRYLSNVEVGGTLDPALASAPSASGSSSGPSPEGRDASIERQTIIKAALPLLDKIPAEGTETGEFLRFLDKLDEWIATPRAKPAAPAPAAAEEPAAPKPDDDDDDIPF